MKKLPIGIQNFPEIRTQNHCYVDKTPLIAQLVNQGKYYFLARPRRFGKSLLLSTLACAFSGQKTLFDGLYLEQNWDWSVQYPVIHLSLGRGVVGSRAELDSRLKVLLSEVATSYQLTLRDKNVADQFSELIQLLQANNQQPVVILIDEYDKPILDNIEKSELAIEIREGLKNFYSVIKDSDAYLKFVFLTGVSKFSKVSLFSGLNNLEDITLTGTFATICGYTEQETRLAFADYLQDVDFNELRSWYNGYNFLGEKVYNPFDVLLFLRNRDYKNYWFETGSPSFLIKLIQERQYFVPELEGYTADEDFLSSFDVNEIELESLLFQAGYLTIEKVLLEGSRRAYKLCYPNREVKMSFANVVLRHFSHAPRYQQRNLSEVYYALCGRDFARLQAVFTAFFASIPHDWYRKNQLAQYEGFYASLVYCYFTALGFDSVAEDATQLGQIDLTVKTADAIFILEFKVVGCAEGRALAQITAKNYQAKYVNEKKAIFLIGVEFNAQERNIVGFDWLQVV